MNFRTGTKTDSSASRPVEVPLTDSKEGSRKVGEICEEDESVFPFMSGFATFSINV